MSVESDLELLFLAARVSPELRDAVERVRAYIVETRDVRLTWDEIAAFFSDVEEPIKVMKVGEENGEAVEAYIGLHGHNVRKGVTHTRRDVAKELADVAITAYVALHAFDGDPWATLGERAAEVLQRLEAVAA